eukprot:gene6309-6544_t
MLPLLLFLTALIAGAGAPASPAYRIDIAIDSSAVEKGQLASNFRKFSQATQGQQSREEVAASVNDPSVPAVFDVPVSQQISAVAATIPLQHNGSQPPVEAEVVAPLAGDSWVLRATNADQQPSVAARGGQFLADLSSSLTSSVQSSVARAAVDRGSSQAINIGRAGNDSSKAGPSSSSGDTSVTAQVIALMPALQEASVQAITLRSLPDRELSSTSGPRDSTANVAEAEADSTQYMQFFQHYQQQEQQQPRWQPPRLHLHGKVPVWRSESWHVPEAAAAKLYDRHELPPPPGKLARSASSPQAFLVQSPSEALDEALATAAHTTDHAHVRAAAGRPTAPAAAIDLANNTAAGWKPRTAAAEAISASIWPSGAAVSSSAKLIRAFSSISSGTNSGASSLKPTASGLGRSTSIGGGSLRQLWISGGSRPQHTPNTGAACDTSSMAMISQTKGQLQPAAVLDSTIVEPLRQPGKGPAADLHRPSPWTPRLTAVGAAQGPPGHIVSRRISPAISVLEDRSSATSTDSQHPAAWQTSDRQLLEDTPGWLKIHFAREVRLERKLGEGGFGQVFQARWRDEVIAAKLVPFMSLVAHHHHLPVTLTSADPAAAAASAAVSSPPAAAGESHHFRPVAAGHNEELMMGLGMRYSAAALRAIKMEIRVLSQLCHPHIIAFKGACLAPPHICILEELAEGGSLWSRLHSRSSRRTQAAAGARSRPHPPGSSSAQTPQARDSRPGQQQCPRRSLSDSAGVRMQLPPPLSAREVLSIACDVARAMHYLHTLQPQVVHRDLKPQNVLLDLQGRAKVCDFGISKMRDVSLAVSSTRLQAGTPAYMAPEQFEGCPVTEKVDVFAFGVLLWECFEQQQPWKDLSPMQIIYAVGLQKDRLRRPLRCPDAMWELIEACWKQEPEERPAFSSVLATLEEQHRRQQQQQQEHDQEKQQRQGQTEQKPQQQPRLEEHAEVQRHHYSDQLGMVDNLDVLIEAATAPLDTA